MHTGPRLIHYALSGCFSLMILAGTGPSHMVAAEAPPQTSAASPADVQKAAEDAAQNEVDSALNAARAVAKALMTKLDGEGLTSSDLALARVIVENLENGSIDNTSDVIPDTSTLSLYRRDFVPVRNAYRLVFSAVSRGRAAVRRAQEERMMTDPQYKAQVEAQERTDQELLAKQQSESDAQEKARQEIVELQNLEQLKKREREEKWSVEQLKKREREEKWSGTKVTQDDQKLSAFFEYRNEIDSHPRDEESQARRDIRDRYEGKRTKMFLAWNNIPPADGYQSSDGYQFFTRLHFMEYVDPKAEWTPDGRRNVLFQYYGITHMSDAMILRSSSSVTHKLGAVTLDVVSLFTNADLSFDKSQNEAVSKAMSVMKRIAEEREGRRAFCVFEITAEMIFDKQTGFLKGLRNATLDAPLKIYAYPEMTLLYPVEGPAAATPTP